MNYYAAPACRKGGSKRCFCPSVAYIVNSWRTGRPSVPSFGMRLAYQFQGQTVKVSRPINANTHRAPCLPNGKAYELHTRYTDGGRRPAWPREPRPTRSKVKVARSRDQSEPCWSSAVPVSLEAGRGIPCRPNPAATLLVINY